jgi:hypothetical protein
LTVSRSKKIEGEKLDSDDDYFSLKLEINGIFTDHLFLHFQLHRTNNSFFSITECVLPKTFLRRLICARLSEFYELNNADLQVYSNFSKHTLSLSLNSTPYSISLFLATK